MKKKYLDSLKKALEIYDIDNQKEVLDRFEKRYDFGLEAGLSESEIEQMLGKPADVAKKLWADSNKNNNQSNSTNTPTIKSGYNLIVKTVADDIVIKESKDDKVHTYFENIDIDCYEIKNNVDEGVLIKYYKSKYFSLNRKSDGVIIVEIPNNKIFDKVKVSTTSGDIEIDKLNGRVIDVVVVSGDADFNYITGDAVKLQTVSGDIGGYSVKSKETSLHSVSGDISVSIVTGDIIRIDTVTGDVRIKDSSGTIKSSSVTGDVIIDGVTNKNIKQMIKGVFK